MSARLSAKREALKKAGEWEELQKLPRNASPVRIKNRCAVTGRSRGYMRYFGLSRQQFRESEPGQHLPAQAVQPVLEDRH